MAIAVPFLMSATGASAAIGAAIGVSATMVSTVTAIAFSVTGINDKINKAASKVFGEDLVNFANIAGMGYAMWNGGFDIGSGAEAAGAATEAAFEADFAAASGTSGAMPGEVVNGNFFADSAGTGGAGLDVADAMGASSESFNLNEMASRGPSFDPDLADMEMAAGKTAFSSTEPTNLLNGDTGLKDSKVFQPETVAQTPTAQAVTPQANASAASATTDQYSLASRPSATAANATGINATGKIGLQATGSTGLQAPANALTPATGGNNFSNLINKLLYNQKGELNERLVGGVLQGAASAYTGAQANKVRREQYDDEKRRRDSLAPGRFY